MQRKILISILTLGPAAAASAQSSVEPGRKHAWAENVGWTNWRDANGANDGVIVGTDYLEGYIWGENIGWINVGDGTPANTVNYANVNGTDFGVNIDGDDDLSGFGWGENVGWINFGWGAAGNLAGRARFDFGAGRFRGYIWGENIGWINLDDAVHFVAATVGVPCANDTQCHDSDVCTCDTCVAGSCDYSPIEYGNTNCAGPAHQANLDDILFVLVDFSDGVSATHPSNDLAPACTGNMQINLDDILQVIAAFAGVDPCGCVP